VYAHCAKMKVGSLRASPRLGVCILARKNRKRARQSVRSARRTNPRNRSPSSLIIYERVGIPHDAFARCLVAVCAIIGSDARTRFSSPPSPSRARTPHRRPTPTRPLLAPAPRTRDVALCRATKRFVTLETRRRRARHWTPREAPRVGGTIRVPARNARE